MILIYKLILFFYHINSQQANKELRLMHNDLSFNSKPFFLISSLGVIVSPDLNN